MPRSRTRATRAGRGAASSDENLPTRLGPDPEDALVSRDLVRGAHRLCGVVAELDRGPPVRGHGLADQRKGGEPVARNEPAEVVCQERAPAEGDTRAPREPLVQFLDLADIEPVGKDDQFFLWVLAALLPPSDRDLRTFHRVARVDPDARPPRQPVWCVLQETLCAIRVGQHDAQVSLVFLMPVCEHLIGGLGKLAVVFGEGRVDHRQLVGIRADGLELPPKRDKTVRGADECLPQPLAHRLHSPVLPEKGMPPPGAEIRDPETLEPAQPLDLFPELRHGAGIEYLEFELAEITQYRPAPKLHEHGQGGNLPEHDLRPASLEGKLVLVAHTLEVVGRQPKVLEPFHEVGPEHLPFAIERVAPEPCRFAAAERERSDVIELFAKLALVDEPGQRHRRGSVDEREGDARVWPVAEHRLAHQELVEIGIDERPNDRVDLPFVVPDTGGDIDHARFVAARSSLGKRWTRALPRAPKYFGER